MKNDLLLLQQLMGDDNPYHQDDKGKLSGLPPRARTQYVPNPQSSAPNLYRNLLSQPDPLPQSNQNQSDRMSLPGRISFTQMQQQLNPCAYQAVMRQFAPNNESAQLILQQHNNLNQSLRAAGLVAPQQLVVAQPHQRTILDVRMNFSNGLLTSPAVAAAALQHQPMIPYALEQARLSDLHRQQQLRIQQNLMFGAVENAASSPSLALSGSSLSNCLEQTPTEYQPSNTDLNGDTGTTATAKQNSNETKKAKAGKRSAMDEKWMTKFRQLEDYKREHGDCIVPRGYSSNPKLASWVAEQRKQWKSFQQKGGGAEKLRERIDILNSIGFTWDAQETAWQRNFNDMRLFRVKFGHCNVPVNHKDFPRLGMWVKEQRRHYSLAKKGIKSHITASRIANLNSIGFRWETLQTSWHKRFEELRDYKDLYGDCNVPSQYKDNRGLGTWVQHQRRQYKAWLNGETSHINGNRIQCLNEIGFVWSHKKRGRTDDHSSIGSSRHSGDSDEAFYGEPSVSSQGSAKKQKTCSE